MGYVATPKWLGNELSLEPVRYLTVGVGVAQPSGYVVLPSGDLGDERKRCFHIYFNPARMAAEREQLENKIEKMSSALKQCKGTPVTLGRPYSDYFILNYDENGLLLYAEDRTEVIERELRLCGYFCIVSSESMSAEQAYVLIRYSLEPEACACNPIKLFRPSYLLSLLL